MVMVSALIRSSTRRSARTGNGPKDGRYLGLDVLAAPGSPPSRNHDQYRGGEHDQHHPRQERAEFLVAGRAAVRPSQPLQFHVRQIEVHRQLGGRPCPAPRSTSVAAFSASPASSPLIRCTLAVYRRTPERW
jgi:hypothetical protein